jgi:hypothetical protein
MSHAYNHENHQAGCGGNDLRELVKSNGLNWSCLSDYPVGVRWDDSIKKKSDNVRGLWEADCENYASLASFH